MWIHCTPLVESNGAVWVWVVVIVDDDEQEGEEKVVHDYAVD
jgi:hypothetical protein